MSTLSSNKLASMVFSLCFLWTLGTAATSSCKTDIQPVIEETKQSHGTVDSIMMDIQ